MFDKMKQFFRSLKGESSASESQDNSRSDLSEESASLMRLIQSGKLSSFELGELARAHAHSIEEAECEVCSELDENAEYDIFEQILRQGKNLTPELIEVLARNYESVRAPDGTGAYEGSMLRFLTHPNSSHSQLLESGEYVGFVYRCDQVYDDIDEAEETEYLLDLLSNIFTHPMVDDVVEEKWSEALQEYDFAIRDESWWADLFEKARVAAK